MLLDLYAVIDALLPRSFLQIVGSCHIPFKARCVSPNVN
jgi:hypothetical protein